MSFASADINVTDIKLCILVPDNIGQTVHKNRTSHGLVIQLGGKREYVFDSGERMTVEEGDIFYLPKFSSYRVVKILSGDCIAVNFDIADTTLTFGCFTFKPTHFSQYKHNFSKLLMNWIVKDGRHMNICRSVLYSLICDIQADLSKSYASPKVKGIAADSVNYIFQNLHETDLTVARISEYFGISPEYFRALFKNVYGISPRRYIIEARMKKAAELIRSGELMICEISRLCGYESEAYFSTEFKKYYNISPSEFR